MLGLMIISLAIASASAIVCAPNQCDTVRCAAVTAENCAGKIVPHGGFCGCCDSCVHIIAEGGSCIQDFLFGGGPRTAVCDDRLVCDATTVTCQDPSKVQGVGKRQINVINTGSTSTVSCAQRLLEIQAASARGMPLLGQPVPTCAADGSYAPRQCEGSVCYCVDPYGNRIQGYSVSIGQSATMDCQCARDQHAYTQTGLIGRLFTCTQSGSYERYACTGSVCYCADNLGNMRDGTATVNIGNIGALQC